jgi:Fungal specific transcription factor domain
MSRPQIGIDRLPARRLSNEPREAMNCKSCRKRKVRALGVLNAHLDFDSTCGFHGRELTVLKRSNAIVFDQHAKLARSLPALAYTVRRRLWIWSTPNMNADCGIDAVPKKRGPKTDVLEALLKRVDGLEKQLKTQDKPDLPVTPTTDVLLDADGPTSAPDVTSSKSNHPVLDIPPNINNVNGAPALVSPATDSISAPTPTLYPELLVDIYFQRLHGKPLYVLDEISTRNKLQNHTLPSFLAFAIYALSARYASQFGGYSNALRVAHDYSRRARMELDTDEPSIEALQTLILLSQAAFQSGKGKKTYMLLSMAISMAFALNLHRELPTNLNVSRAEREGRRRLFWACYLMDRFAACGTKRPSLISDESIVLRLPGCQIQPGGPMTDGEYFPGTSSGLQYMAQPGKLTTGGTGMLIGIVRILGITNRYLAAGGVKGDSHFPWHSLSNLSKIRQDLDVWASETQDTFTSLETLFGQPDSTILVLSKLVYHLIHCLIYRPFLPVDLAELSGTSQHQSWQIEATNLCFLHANAIAELVEIGKASSIDWPAFIGYCVCTAGTIHVHGAHYRGQNGEVFSTSAEFLSREMQQLQELRYIWAGVQHQRDTLQTIYGAHSDLVKSLASNPIRFSPVFHLEDFFDRYPGLFIDGAHITFNDIAVDLIQERYEMRNPQVGN